MKAKQFAEKTTKLSLTESGLMFLYKVSLVRQSVSKSVDCKGIDCSDLPLTFDHNETKKNNRI